THTTPIVMMSGNQQATEQFYVQRFGADGFIKKPFGRAEVFHAVRSLVQAGRMPARVAVASASVIPEGMTAEEWHAIPDVAMPDEAHLVARAATHDDGDLAPVAAVATMQNSPHATAAPVRSGQPIGTTNLSAVAASPALRPTLTTRPDAAAQRSPPAIMVSLVVSRDPIVAAPRDGEA
ncbi:MAG: hypothetical protein ACREPS_10550, partial [Rhodanobacteraceae bacterium]